MLFRSQEEAEEDFAKMNALLPSEKPYLKTSAVDLWKRRIPWLLLLMVSATFTGMIISSFEDALAVQVVLTAFIPMLMDTGGNSGSQASVTIIRALSLGEVEFSNIGRIIWKELRVAIMCGATLSSITFVKIGRASCREKSVFACGDLGRRRIITKKNPLALT